MNISTNIKLTIICKNIKLIMVCASVKWMIVCISVKQLIACMSMAIYMNVECMIYAIYWQLNNHWTLVFNIGIRICTGMTNRLN